MACTAGVVGLLTSRALVALSPVTGVVAALANPALSRALGQWLRLRTVWAPAAMYALLLLSGFHTEQWNVWRHETFRLLPWLGVPLAFGVAVPLTKRQRSGIGLLYVTGFVLVALATLGQYFLDPAAANKAFGLGQSLPSVTGIFHIHFGLMLALAAFFALLLRHNSHTPGLRLGLLIAAAVCVVTLHLLAYRTGLLVFYVMALLEALRLLLRKRLLLGLGVLFLLVASPLVAYHTLEPVHQRLDATIWDVQQIQLGHDINEYSLSRRLAAWQTALTVAQAHPWLGVGPADAYQAMMNQYSWKNFGLRPENRVMVHNQYLHQLLSGGIVGLSVWLLVLFGPLMQPSLRRNPYVYHFLLMEATAMLVDSLLELQIGFNLFVFLYGFIVVATERRVSQEAETLKPSALPTV
ncbi:O-antigen ligase family protein [Hymenobacter taeanensis]|uniref:O-antigen ligase family protein n=1 Tax=Hymenobacter taeanensis TaxID=2735321 RepID=A0A6M6BDW8_9BACT|nr:O-antigen ligase family protein [Hymenobacter taeanensis]QJX46170.1 O-antigen ligase family protein [Hymenobacter taeanensis]